VLFSSNWIAYRYSPRWLAGKGDWEGAHLASARLRGCKDNMQDIYVLQDMQEMRESIEMQQAAGEGTWMECITGGASGIPRLVYRTVLGCAIQFLQQWTGVNYFFY
jgi:SP family sugar:H+ symporter-like MFS transporter